MGQCALSKRQKNLLRMIARELNNSAPGTKWWIRTQYDTGEAMWQGVEDDQLRDRLQSATKLGDLVMFEKCGFFVDIGQQRYSLSVQKLQDAVDKNFYSTQRKH